MGTRIAVYWDDGAPARVVLFIDSFLVALFRLDVFVEVATLTNTESIQESSTHKRASQCIFDPSTSIKSDLTMMTGDHGMCNMDYPYCDQEAVDGGRRRLREAESSKMSW
jgi:hypothetical protein